MLALGLDPSLRNYGWAVYDSLAVIPSLRRVASGRQGTIPLTVPVARFMHFRSLVADLLCRYSVRVVGMESPAYGSTNASAHYALMMFSLEPIFERRIDCVLFDPVTVKLITAGKGTAGKSDMRRFVQLDTMSSDNISSDEADAYCIAREAMRFVMFMDGKLDSKDLTSGETRAFLTRQRKRGKGASAKIQKVAHVFRENSRWFRFSKIPAGKVDLPAKEAINPGLLKYLESST